MTNKKPTDSRRKLLKSIAVGSGAVVAGKSLPESWSKPVVNAVALPAHALTTNEDTNEGTNEGTIILVVTMSGPGSGDVGVSGVLNDTISIPDDVPKQIEMTVDAGAHLLTILISQSLQPVGFVLMLDDGASSVPSTFIESNNFRDYAITYNVEPGETVTCTLALEAD